MKPVACPLPFPFTHHRNMMQVMVDEAVLRRQRAKYLSPYRKALKARRERPSA